MSHRSHRFTQISSLQATVVTMPHSNRYFSARELRIFFGTRIARITRISCLVSKDSCSTLNIILLSRTRISRISRIFSLQATIRISPRLRLYYITAYGAQLLILTKSNFFILTTHKMILLPYRFCGDSHHAFAFPFVLCILPSAL